MQCAPAIVGWLVPRESSQERPPTYGTGIVPATALPMRRAQPAMCENQRAGCGNRHGDGDLGVPRIGGRQPAEGDRRGLVVPARGAQQCEREGRVAIRELVTRFARIELVDDAPEHRENPILRGLKRLDLKVG